MGESWGDIYALPEDCIATALSLTSPKDACRLSVVASTFRSASQSDAVWCRFLPSDYRDIISRAADADSLLSKFHSKKDLYLHLCHHPILIDECRKSFWLEKSSGKKCYMLAAKDLKIAWVDTPRYWQWVRLPESRFSEVAELQRVCWFEVGGKIKIHMLSSSTNYAAYLVFKCKSTSYGFSHRVAEASVGISGCECEKRGVRLISKGEEREWFQFMHVQRQQEDIPVDGEYPKERDDGWMEIELGECFVNGGEDGDLEVGLMEVKGGNWKSIAIQGIEIRPK